MCARPVHGADIDVGVKRDHGRVVSWKDEKLESILQCVFNDLALNGFESVLGRKNPGDKCTQKEKPNGILSHTAYSSGGDDQGGYLGFLCSRSLRTFSANC